jgi:magnesium chelatase accessory protein
MSPGSTVDTTRLDWDRDGADWPNRDASRFVESDGMRWHVQIMGHGPTLLMLHGTGAGTHSWRDLAPLLAQHFTLVMPDLPGHAFTAMPHRNGMTLPGMAHAVGQLLRTLNIEPQYAVGHSAGAAVLARMALDKSVAPKLLVSINGAMLPFSGIAGVVFPPLARLLYLNPFAPRFLAWRGENRKTVEDLLKSVGSEIDSKGLDLYHRLFRSRVHVNAALEMMANWDLQTLWEMLPRLPVPLLLIVCSGDRAIEPERGVKVREIVPGARLTYLRGLGHLAHEEKPQELAVIIRDACLRPGTVGDQL